MKARYALYAILTLVTLVALPQSVSAATYCINNISSPESSFEHSLILFNSTYAAPSGRPYSLGAFFAATTTCSFRYVDIPLRMSTASTTLDSEIDLVMEVFEVSTTTSPLDTGPLYTSYEVHYIRSTTSENYTFTFPELAWLDSGTNYVFAVQEVDTWAASQGTALYWQSKGNRSDLKMIFYRDGVTSPVDICGLLDGDACLTGSSYGIDYDSVSYSGHSPAISVYSGEQLDQSITLDIYDPTGTTLYCSVDSEIDNSVICNNETITSSSTGGFLISGTTTSAVSPYRWYITVGDDYDDWKNNYNQAAYSTGFYTQVSPYFYEWSFEPKSFFTGGNTYQVAACIGDQDYYLGVNDAAYGNCVYIFFGNGLDATTTNERAVEQGIAVDSSNWVPPTNTSDECGLLLSDGWLTCTLTDIAIDILTTWPFGYVTEPFLGYWDYKNTHASTSAHFIVGFNVSPYFDNPDNDISIPTSTTTWNLTTASRQSMSFSPDLFNEIDDFLWAMMWLYMAYRALTGYWYSSAEGGLSWYTRGKDADRRRELSQRHYDMRRVQTAYYKYNVMKKK